MANNNGLQGTGTRTTRNIPEGGAGDWVELENRRIPADGSYDPHPDTLSRQTPHSIMKDGKINLGGFAAACMLVLSLCGYVAQSQITQVGCS